MHRRCTENLKAAMSETNKIFVNIAGRNYPVLVEGKEEEALRTLESLIKGRYLNLVKEYPNHDNQDLLAMVLLSLGSTLLQDSVQSNTASFQEQVDGMIARLERHLL